MMMICIFLKCFKAVDVLLLKPLLAEFFRFQSACLKVVYYIYDEQALGLNRFILQICSYLCLKHVRNYYFVTCKCKCISFCYYAIMNSIVTIQRNSSQSNQSWQMTKLQNWNSNVLITVFSTVVNDCEIVSWL